MILKFKNATLTIAILSSLFVSEIHAAPKLSGPALETIEGLKRNNVSFVVYSKDYENAEGDTKTQIAILVASKNQLDTKLRKIETSGEVNGKGLATTAATYLATFILPISIFNEVKHHVPAVTVDRLLGRIIQEPIDRSRGLLTNHFGKIVSGYQYASNVVAAARYVYVGVDLLIAPYFDLENSFFGTVYFSARERNRNVADSGSKQALKELEFAQADLSENGAVVVTEKRFFKRTQKKFEEAGYAVVGPVNY